MKTLDETVYIQYVAPDKGYDPDGTVHYRIRWREPKDSRIWDDFVCRYPNETAALDRFKDITSIVRGRGRNKVAFEEVTI